MKLSLYIHIPFCSAKCRYCDFFSVPFADRFEQGTLQKNLLDGILNELQLRLDGLPAFQIGTIFIGGGTPSAIKPELLDRFLTSLEDKLKGLKSEQIEFSIEANPESCSDEFLSVIKRHQINRLSIGVQSFNTATLQTIGRASFPENMYTSVLKIREAWKKKLSLDIITGVNQDYLDDINKAAAAGPEHLSVYALTFEENTPLFDDLLKKKIAAPDEELQAEAITAAGKLLSEKGYHRYEISNFAKPSADDSNECEHNLAYWNMQSYIGLGPAAVSSFYFSDEKTRVTNTENIEDYISCFTHNKTEVSSCRSTEVLTDFDFILEHYMMGGRLKKGIDRTVFFERFGCQPEYFIPETLARWNTSGLLGSGACALNDVGMLLLNRFLSEIYDELKKITFF